MSWFALGVPAEAGQMPVFAAFLEPAGPWHCGVLYEDRWGEPWYLDLASHRELQRQSATRPSAWVTPEIDPILQEQLCERCDLIWARDQEKAPEQRLPYGFRYEGALFDEQGEPVFDPVLEHGLTCATFVLAVFASVGLQLMDLPSWPAATEVDRRWRALVLQLLPFSEQERERLRSELECRRFHPPEVVAACAHLPLCPYERARVAANALEEALRPKVG